MVVSQLINSQTELKVQYQGRHTNKEQGRVHMHASIYTITNFVKLLMRLSQMVCRSPVRQKKSRRKGSLDN